MKEEKDVVLEDKLRDLDALPVDLEKKATPVGDVQEDQDASELMQADLLEEGSDGAGTPDAMSEASEAGESTDGEDVFNIQARSAADLSGEYQIFFLYRWKEAVAELRSHLRKEVLLPVNPLPNARTEEWRKVTTGIVLPSWHCAFAGCTASSTSVAGRDNHEYELWNHLWISGGHRLVFNSIIDKYELLEQGVDSGEVALTLYNLALAEQESYVAHHGSLV